MGKSGLLNGREMTYWAREKKLIERAHNAG